MRIVERLQTIGEVAKELQIDRWRLAYLIERGTLPDATVKVPGRRLFAPTDVTALKTALEQYKRGKRALGDDPEQQQSNGAGRTDR
jgi:DNA-binding transcriptional MerR regulator